MDNTAIIANHLKDKQRSHEFKKRRYSQWNENYILSRDKVITNRLTQRQPINVPVIRESIQSWISKIDEAPKLSFSSRGNGNKDKDGEIILNELWDYDFDRLKLELVDNLEKKVVGLTGRGFKKWGWANGDIFCDVIDPYDIDIDPTCNVLDLNSANYIIHKNIFRSLRSILANPKYDEAAKKELKTFLATKEGIIATNLTHEAYLEKKQRLELIGVENYDTEFQAGDIIVELNEDYKIIWSEAEKRFVRHVIVIAADKYVLSNKPMKEALGLSRLPIVSWASDPDLNDIWSDGIADNVRTFNKVVNMYISQDLENRTYRNFGMYFYNTLGGTFSPKTFDPKPFGMYGIPGKPSEMVEQMRIEPLNDTAQQITFLKNLIQSSVSQTSIERGEVQEGDTTLGEVKLSLQQSQKKNAVVSKNYRTAWEESGYIWYELRQENMKGTIKLWKKGANGVFYSKDVAPSDWKQAQGYEIKVVLRADKEAEDDQALKKLQYVKQSFEGNPVAQKIIRRKELELLGWTTEDIDAVMQAEEQPTQPPTMPGQIPGQQVTQPQPTQM